MKSGIEFVIPETVSSINYSVFYLSRFTSVTIPNSVLTIESIAFRNSYLQSVTFPKSVKSIGYYAFGDCIYLESITIPNSVTTIEDRAFQNTASLTSLTVEWTTPLSIPAETFFNVNKSSVTLRVPTGTKTLYQRADVWKDFGTIEEYIPSSIERVESQTLQAYASNGILHVAGLVTGEPLTIYNIKGQLVYNIIAKSETEQIPLKEHGIYIIVSDNHAIKVVVK